MKGYHTKLIAISSKHVFTLRTYKLVDVGPTCDQFADLNYSSKKHKSTIRLFIFLRLIQSKIDSVASILLSYFFIHCTNGINIVEKDTWISYTMQISGLAILFIAALSAIALLPLTQAAKNMVQQAQLVA